MLLSLEKFKARHFTLFRGKKRERLPLARCCTKIIALQNEVAKKAARVKTTHWQN
jgi:hypothetical protein